MSTRDELEAALRARPDDATLGVYADLLQAQGDPRGELIALDLRPPELSTHGIETRRGQLLRAWLGDDLEIHFDREHQLWHAGDLVATYATFDCGFVDLVVTDEDDRTNHIIPRLLASRAGDYVRRLSLSGPTELLEPVLGQLAARPRPWLQQLALARPHEARLLVGPALRDRLVAATPNLEVLDLLGRDLLDRFTHPTVRELGVTGSDSIDLAAGPPLPALHTIDFAFDGDRPTPRGLFAPARVPALRRLNLSREEPGTPAFAALGGLAVAPQLAHLVLPALRTPRDVTLVEAAIRRMPLLREIVIARAYECFRVGHELRHDWARVSVPTPWPWPPRDRLPEQMLVIDGHATELGALTLLLEAQHDELPEELRAIWYRFWTTVGAIGLGEQAFSASDLAAALDGLVLTSHLAALRDHLRSRLGQRPGGLFVAMHWA